MVDEETHKDSGVLNIKAVKRETESTRGEQGGCGAVALFQRVTYVPHRTKCRIREGRVAELLTEQRDVDRLRHGALIRSLGAAQLWSSPKFVKPCNRKPKISKHLESTRLYLHVEYYASSSTTRQKPGRDSQRYSSTLDEGVRNNGRRFKQNNR